MDTLDEGQRSVRMALIRSKNTKPELLVRRLVHGLGYRYRLHRRALPGTPDLVFPGRSKVIFVHGCFWHRHPGCALVRLPKSRPEFWVPKLEGSAERDARDVRALRRLGWSVMTIWECQLRDMARLENRIRRFLDAKR
jgi:DNA mismatch endonuclease (patch repair protein)